MTGTAAAPTGEARPPRARAAAPGSSLTRRILAVNVLALALLLVGLLYLDQYRRGLVSARTDALLIQGSLVAVALSEVALVEDAVGLEVARTLVRRMVALTGARVRLFDDAGRLVADSRVLSPTPSLATEGREPTLAERAGLAAEQINRALARWFSRRPPLPPYLDVPQAVAGDFPEVVRALGGDPAAILRDAEGIEVLSVAVPVRRAQRVQGALMLSAPMFAVEAEVRAVRMAILQIFAICLGITALLSVYLASTIARPVRRLAEAADRVRRGERLNVAIPDFTDRHDEIGDLSDSLGAMTAALWQRIDAVEQFAADVAHELKNPLSSMRSALETAVRIQEPAQRDMLLALVQDDVRRLDRLITDIADASRLDAEMSRAAFGVVDLARLLGVLAEVHAATAGAAAPRMRLDLPTGPLRVRGIEDRLGQVFRNLIANAVSFSPPGGTIAVTAGREGDLIVIAVEDDGPGIPPGKESAIFERFYSERPAGERFGTHSGLGLSISRQIVEAHGGTIAGHNRAGAQGARFEVRLPALVGE